MNEKMNRIESLYNMLYKETDEIYGKLAHFFIVKVLVKSNKGGCEVTLIYFYTYYMYPFFHF